MNQSHIDKAVNILREDYPYVKRAIARLEVYTGESSKRSVFELRDALDHLFLAFNENTSDEDADSSLNAIREHLRRAAVEPLECIAEQEKIKLLKMQKRGFWWWKFFLLKPPNIKDFVKEIYRGNDYLIEGRQNKGVSIKSSVENMQKAYETFYNLRDKLQPSELRSRIFAVLLTAVAFLLGYLL